MLCHRPKQLYSLANKSSTYAEELPTSSVCEHIACPLESYCVYPHIFMWRPEEKFGCPHSPVWSLFECFEKESLTESQTQVSSGLAGQKVLQICLLETPCTEVPGTWSLWTQALNSGYHTCRTSSLTHWEPFSQARLHQDSYYGGDASASLKGFNPNHTTLIYIILYPVYKGKQQIPRILNKLAKTS